ncbi:hypothetical protein [Aestuariispira insulae]|uniref:Uncharacterized protein n=1 Tax=Aestuariispira insulae TaxID=1461337 RepID=A0A3D9HFI8_9PROT|nr:hypothetical protein [Aestuariispira insulae]RED48011.1 hypothetical protein DFP90_10828 [Aestuariispira insulae]
MDEVDYNAEIALLINEMQGEPEDIHEIQMRLRQMISTMRAEGLPVPEDIKKLEAELDKALSGEAD